MNPIALRLSEIALTLEGGNVPEIVAAIEIAEGEINRLQEIADRAQKIEDLLRSAHHIAAREGKDVHWGRFAESCKRLGVGAITARTYRILPSDLEPQSEKDANRI